MKDFIYVVNFIISKEQIFELYPFSFIVIFDIILQFIFSYLILNIHFYKLQYFSLFLNVAICIIILIIDIVNYCKFEPFEWQLFILYPCYLIFYCLVFVYGKKVILYGYISVYLLIIIKGFIKLILNVLFFAILLIINTRPFKDMSLIFQLPKYSILIASYTIVNFFLLLFLWIIVERLSPNHAPLVFILEELTNFINNIIISEENITENIMGWDLYMRIILYVISLIGVFIHNEIVVINICELGSDTKYFLDIEVKEEEVFSKSDNPEVLKRYETFIELEEQNKERVTIEEKNTNNN
jgi:hypothetical protein